LLLALSALSEPSNDRRQFVLDRNLSPTASYRPGKKRYLSSSSLHAWIIAPLALNNCYNYSAN